MRRSIIGPPEVVFSTRNPPFCPSQPGTLLLSPLRWVFPPRLCLRPSFIAWQELSPPLCVQGLRSCSTIPAAQFPRTPFGVFLASRPLLVIFFSFISSPRGFSRSPLTLRLSTGTKASLGRCALRRVLDFCHSALRLLPSVTCIRVS